MPQNNDVDWPEILQHFLHLLIGWPVVLLKLYLLYMLAKTFIEVMFNS